MKNSYVENNKVIVSAQNIKENVMPRLRPSCNLADIERDDIAYCKFLDMIETFYITVNEKIGVRLNISTDILEKIGMTLDELRDCAHRNIAGNWKMMKLTEVIEQLTGNDNIPDTDNPLYVVSTNESMYGAATVLSEEIMEVVTERLKGGFVILPSSVHEVLVLSKKDLDEYGTLLEIVRSINRTEVSETEFLSDNIYIYEDGSYRIVD